MTKEVEPGEREKKKREASLTSYSIVLSNIQHQREDIICRQMFNINVENVSGSDVDGQRTRNVRSHTESQTFTMAQFL